VRRVADSAATLRRSERGYTLIELLVASTMAMVVLGGAVTVFIGAVRSEPRTSSKVAAIEQGRIQVERITREVRQGVDVVTAASNELVLITYVKQASCGGVAASTSIACRVIYACSEGRCTRRVAQPNGGSPGIPVQVVSGLSSNAVFTYAPPSDPEPEYVGVNLSFETREGSPVVVADGATLRNWGSS
jgi:type II secretory pathway pseudopilin PulG